MALRIFLLGVLVFLIMAPAYYFVLVTPSFDQAWWWDLPLHLLGGVWASLIAAWFIVIAGERPSAYQCVLFTLYCGVAWEILEFSLGLGGNPAMHPALDTTKDFIVDVIGGYAAFASLRVLRIV